MKNIINKLLFVIVFAIIIIFDIAFIVMDKKEFSEQENRYLESFSLDNIESYIADHFPFRTNLLAFKNKMEVYTGKSMIGGVYVAEDNYLIPTFKDNENKDYLIESINDFAEGKSNIDVMIVPDSIFVNGDKVKNSLPTNEKEIEYIYSNLKYTNNIDVTDVLKNNNTKYNMYYKTDHHWTTYGAFVAYQEYFNSKGYLPLSMQDFKIEKVSDEFLGTSSSLALGLAQEEDIYIFNRDNNLKVNYVYENKITDTLYNLDYLNKKDKYALFLDNNHGLIQIDNLDLNDNSNILIIKNSYANSFVPFVVNHYQNTHVIDLRYFGGKVSDYIKDNNIENILILYNLNNFYSDMSIIKLK